MVAVRLVVRTVLLVAILLAAAAPAAAQPFLEAYRSGLEAIEQEDWATAERLLETAAGERPESAERLLRFLHFRPYVPHLYLGIARFRQGDCAGALEAWEEAERRGVAPQVDEAWPTVVDGRTECRRRLERAEEARRSEAALERLRTRIEQAVGEAEDLADEAARPEDRDLWSRGSPPPAERLETARRDLREARRLLEETDGEPSGADALERARELADRAAGAVQEIRAQVEERRRSLRARQGTERERLEALRATARRLLDRTEDLAAEVPAVARERDALRDALEGAAGGEELPLVELERRRGRLATAVARLREISEPPPPELLEAADAYLSGELERALEMLREPALAASDEPRVRAHAALLRAAARFTLWQAGGGADLNLLEAAEEDVRAARAAEPELSPLPQAFSPRFLAFFEANREEEGAGEGTGEPSG